MEKSNNNTPLIIGAGIALLFGKQILDKLQSKVKEDQVNTQIEVYKQSEKSNVYRILIRYSNGTSKYKYINLDTLAAEIYDAFYNAGLFGFWKNQDRAIKAINNVPISLIPRLSALYNVKFGKTLKDDFIKFLSTSDYAKVGQKFLR